MTDTLLTDCLNFSSTIAKRYYKCYKVLFTVCSISCEDLIQEANVEALKVYRNWQDNPTYNLKAHLSMAVGWKRMNQMRRGLLKKIYSTGIVKGKDIETILKELRKFTPEDIQCLEVKNNYNIEDEEEIVEQEEDIPSPEYFEEEEKLSQSDVIIHNNEQLFYDIYYKNTYNVDLIKNLGELDYNFYENYILKKIKNKNAIKILRMRVLEHKTFEKIGDILGISRQGIEQMMRKIANAIIRYNELVDK